MKVKSIRLLFGVIVLGALGLAVVVAILVRISSAGPPLPNPNGYDDFVKAGAAVSGPVGEYRTLDREELAALVSANAESLRLLRSGLTRPCRMPVEAAVSNSKGLLNELSGMKRLAQLLAAEGRLGELDNEPAEAARSYLDAIRMGNEMSRGGMLINRLVGVACEAIGAQTLAKMIPKLSRSECRALQVDLEKVDAERVTWDEVVSSEKSFIWYHLKHQFNPILLVSSWWNMSAAFKRAELRHKTVIAHERLLIVELALRSFQLDKGQIPRGSDELLTNYLAKVPRDPFSNGPVIYRVLPGNVSLVYSVGPDGQDDGGKPASRGPSPKGDILANSDW